MGVNDLAPQVHSPGGFRGEDAGVDLVLVGHGLHATHRRRELFHLVVELGAGTGVQTGEILARLGPDARLVSLEIDPDLADTAAFCEAYDVAMEASANCVLVYGRRGETTTYAAVMVLATDRAMGFVTRWPEARG
mgnify:CR=1 FL=1